MTDFERKYKLANRKVKAKKGFYYHLSSYVIMGIFFFFINVFADPGEIWFPIPLAAWGIGIAFHYLAVFGVPGKKKLLTPEWEKKQLAKELKALGVFEHDDHDLADESLDLKELRTEKLKNWNEDDLV